MLTENQAKEKLAELSEGGANYIRVGVMTYQGGKTENDYYVSYERKGKWYSGGGFRGKRLLTISTKIKRLNRGSNYYGITKTDQRNKRINC